MRTVSEIRTALFELAPAYMKEDWDNVGLLCGREDREVQTVLVALDPFPESAKEAKEKGAQLLVTHHPLIHGGIRAVTDESVTGRTLLYLIENGISAINLHTNLDSAPHGVNDALASALGLTNVKVLKPAGENEQGKPYGLGRFGDAAPVSLGDFLGKVKEKLGCSGLRYVDGGKQVRKVAVGGGSCGDLLPLAVKLGCDTFVTADLKYNMFAEAKALGLNLIDAGHYATEHVICPWLAKQLRTSFPELNILESEANRDCIQFF